MRADAESSCTESCTDSWSQDGARNPWSAPTTGLWAPTRRHHQRRGHLPRNRTDITPTFCGAGEGIVLVDAACSGTGCGHPQGGRRRGGRPATRQRCAAPAPKVGSIRDGCPRCANVACWPSHRRCRCRPRRRSGDGRRLEPSSGGAVALHAAVSALRARRRSQQLLTVERQQRTKQIPASARS